MSLAGDAGERSPRIAEGGRLPLGCGMWADRRNIMRVRFGAFRVKHAKPSPSGLGFFTFCANW